MNIHSNCYNSYAVRLRHFKEICGTEDTWTWSVVHMCFINMYRVGSFDRDCGKIGVM